MTKTAAHTLNTITTTYNYYYYYYCCCCCYQQSAFHVEVSLRDINLRIIIQINSEKEANAARFQLLLLLGMYRNLIRSYAILSVHFVPT